MADPDNDPASEGSLTAAMSGGDDFLVEQPEKKKANPVLVGVLLLAIVGGGGFLAARHFQLLGPERAAAATGNAGAARQTISEFLASGGKEIAAMEQMLRNTEQIVQQFLAYPGQTQVPLSELATNPFRFAPPAAEQPTASDAQRQREEARQRAIRSVSNLRVESIMTGPRGGSAIINGVVVRAGDTVEGFRIEEIRGSSVIVRDEAFRFELRLGN